MKTSIFLIFFATILSIAVLSDAQSAASPRRCMTCDKLLGMEVPDSKLSADPDFQKNGMFQKCRNCLRREMSPQAEKAYERIALRYKWNSIEHNIRLSSDKLGRRKATGR